MSAGTVLLYAVIIGIGWGTGSAIGAMLWMVAADAWRRRRLRKAWGYDGPERVDVRSDMPGCR